jgi:hypothetical protein
MGEDQAQRMLYAWNRFCLFLGFSFELVTNVVPVVMACVLGWKYRSEFDHALFASAVGLTSVTIAVAPVLTRQKQDSDFTKGLEKLQPVVDKASWTLMAAVLLTSAIDITTHIFYPNGLNDSRGIPFLTEFDYVVEKEGWRFSALDIFSLLLGLATIFTPTFAAFAASKLRITNDRKLRTLFILLFFPIVAFSFVTGLYAVSVLDKAATIGPAVPSPKITPPDLKWAAIGATLFIWGYLLRHRTIIELYRQIFKKKWNKDDRLTWLETLRTLVFESVVIPPIIVGAALVSGTLDEGTAAVYGVFVYSGFSVWNLSSKVILEARTRVEGCCAVVLQLIYSFLMTVLWAIIFWRLRIFVSGTDDAAFYSDIFNAVLRFAVAAVFVQLVFGPVYRNAWGHSLSDRWLREGSEYAVLATVICVALAAMPERTEKAIWIISIVAILIVVPAWLLRRSLVAYVLLRVFPGRTEEVRKSLVASDISTAVVYGDFDIIAKIEVPGRTAILRGKKRFDSVNLGALAASVKKAVRQGGSGVRETQTLLDFSDFVQGPQHHIDDRKSEEPSKILPELSNFSNRRVFKNKNNTRQRTKKRRGHFRRNIRDLVEKSD